MRRSAATRARPAGSRVFIRRPRPSDERAFLSLVRKSRALHRGWVSPPSTRKAFAAWLARGRRKTHVPLLVCLREGSAIAAVVNLSESVRGSYEGAYLGYYSMAPHSGEGYLSEGLALVLDFAFGKHRLHRLEANIQPANTRSKALVRRLGFVREGYSERYLKVAGRFRDHERWAIRKEIWPRPPARRDPGRAWT
jgi:[ribosomal protein S5]-alanine N-acetyltransferase